MQYCGLVLEATAEGQVLFQRTALEIQNEFCHPPVLMVQFVGNEVGGVAVAAAVAVPFAPVQLSE
jgi:hypothetical protein